MPQEKKPSQEIIPEKNGHNDAVRLAQALMTKDFHTIQNTLCSIDIITKSIILNCPFEGKYPLIHGLETLNANIVTLLLIEGASYDVELPEEDTDITTCFDQAMTRFFFHRDSEVKKEVPYILVNNKALLDKILQGCHKGPYQCLDRQIIGEQLMKLVLYAPERGQFDKVAINPSFLSEVQNGSSNPTWPVNDQLENTYLMALECFVQNLDFFSENGANCQCIIKKLNENHKNVERLREVLQHHVLMNKHLKETIRDLESKLLIFSHKEEKRLAYLNLAEPSSPTSKTKYKNKPL